MQQIMQQMQQWEYKVAYIDYRGRISVEGEEVRIGDQRRTAFVRQFLDGLGADGWELTSIQPLGPHAAYYVFKRPRASGSSAHPTPSDASITTL